MTEAFPLSGPQHCQRMLVEVVVVVLSKILNIKSAGYNPRHKGHKPR